LDVLADIVEHLTPDNHSSAVALASLPEKIRGFGHVKQRHIAAAQAEEAALREQFGAGSTPLLKAAE
jgi:indolepyruvate ferredoxin oxidoreductase